MSEFSHLKNKLLAEQVEDQIYHYILDEALEPGAKLPNEFALGEKFRVGRSTIREAVKLLSSKGIVEVRQGSGTYVVTTVKGLSDPLNLRSVQDKNALAFDLVNVRLLLEPGIAEMAAQNATPEDIERAASMADVRDNIVDFKDGYETVLGERGVTVSGGQKQRISIARALLKDAPILILDDSVSAVDTSTEKIILDNLRNSRAGKTTLLIAHRISTVERLDKIVFLNEGRVEAVGPHDQLYASCPEYRRMVDLQRLEDETKGGENA